MSATGSRVLILNSQSSPKSKFEAFAENLAAKGFELTWRDAANSEPKLTEYDERQFDHIVFLGTDQDSECQCNDPYQENELTHCSTFIGVQR